MLRTAQLSPTCLACSTPLAGALALPARLMGIGRSAENPNLCSRCNQHLAAGEIHSVCLLQIELDRNLRFGSVNLEQLSVRELPALRDQLRSRLEQRGALVMPVGEDRPLLLSGYFNAPVQQQQPELAAYEALLACLDWLITESVSLGVNCGWKAALTTGYAELVPCDGPVACVPIGQVTFQALRLIDRARSGQALVDRYFLSSLAAQDPELPLDGLLAQLERTDQADDRPLLLLDSQASGTSLERWRSSSASWTPQVSRWAQAGALLLAVIAAPCAAMVVLAPGAAFLGLGAVAAALLPFWGKVGMSFWPRVLLTLGAVLIASINLVRAELVNRRFDRLQRQVGSQLQLPVLQRRRLRLIRWTSSVVLFVVAIEGVLRVVWMKMPLF